MACLNLSVESGRPVAAAPYLLPQLCVAYLRHWQSLHLQHLHSLQLQLAHLQQLQGLLPVDDLLAGSVVFALVFVFILSVLKERPIAAGHTIRLHPVGRSTGKKGCSKVRGCVNDEHDLHATTPLDLRHHRLCCRRLSFPSARSGDGCRTLP